ncbi:MAG TPA: sialidase family protein, partial [Myxococcales bacterium]|nr:sialidase family protein [Myxococcales bacterium]
MGTRTETLRLPRRLLLGVVIALVTPAVATAASLHTTLLGKAGYGSTPAGFARTADGMLHVVLDSNTNWGNSYNGIAALSISPSGHVGPPVQAVNWNGQSAQGIPGLAVLPSGALEATWGGYPFGSDGPWGISSSDGGATWSAPANIGSGSMGFGDSHVPVVVSNGAPVLAAGCCGNLVIQQGFGSGSPTFQVTNSTDGCAGNSDLAVDDATGAAIASWDSCDGSGGLWLQQVAPSEGTPVKLAVPSQYGTGLPEILAGRDAAAGGVFAAYPTNYANTTHIDLYRYGGGSTSVGSVKRLHADVWGAATGSDGRVWVMWYGQNTKTGKYEIAVTRSNNGINAFEPIQVFGLSYSYLFWLAGDGGLGALDMLISGTPSGNGAAGGIYYARVIPVLSARISAHGIKNSLGKVSAYKFKVKVTDAGDPVAG